MLLIHKELSWVEMAPPAISALFCENTLFNMVIFDLDMPMLPPCVAELFEKIMFSNKRVVFFTSTAPPIVLDTCVGWHIHVGESYNIGYYIIEIQSSMLVLLLC